MQRSPEGNIIEKRRLDFFVLLNEMIVEKGGDRQYWLYEEWVRVTGVCKRERWRTSALSS